MSGTTIDLTDPVWAGGSGDLSSNWITGYVETDTDGVQTFDSWVMGTPGTAATVEFLSTLSTPVQNDTLVSAGGTLDGILNTGTVIFNNPTTYTLNGDLSASLGNLDVGTVIVGGTLSFSTGLDLAGELDIIGGGSLFVGATPSSGGIALVGGPAVLTVSGAGSSLTDQGDLGTSALSVTDGAVVTVGGNELGLTGGTTVTVDADSAMEIGGTANLKTGTIVIDPGDLAYLGQGSAQINGAIENNGTIENGSGAAVGTLTLTGAIAGSGTLDVLANQSGTTTLPGVSDLVLDGAVGNGQTVDFSGPSGLLTVGGFNNFDALVSGFQQGDTIDLLGVAANAWMFNAGTLTLSETSDTGSTTVGGLHFNGIGADQTFVLSSDGNNGTDITVGAATITATPTIVAPGTATVGIGQTNPIAGISVAESPTTSGETFTVVLTDTNGVLSVNTSAPGGGGTITPSNGGTTLTISGTLAQVNADLSTLKDDDASTDPDTIKVDASDTNGGVAAPASIAVTVNGLPFIAAPAILKATQAKATALKGVSVSETGNTTTSGETFTVKLTDAHGVLAATIPAAGGGTVTPSDGGLTLTVVGTLAQVNADLATLTDNDAVGAPDTIAITATDTFGNAAAAKSVAVSVKGKTVKPVKPKITAPKTVTVSVGQVSHISGISLSETTTTSGETFTAVLTDANGVLAATTAAAGGGGTVAPSNGGKTLTIMGTLAQVNADLTTLTDKDGSTAADKITVNAHDSNGGVATAATIAVTVNGKLGNGNFTVALTGSNNAVTIGNGNSDVSGGQNGNVIAIGNGNSTVSLSGSGNSVTLGNGNGTVIAGGGGNKITVGNGNNMIALGGSASTVTLGNGADAVHGGTGDAINLANTTLTLYGTDEMVFIGTDAATVNDFSTGLDLKIGPTAGVDVLSHFASDPSGVVDLIGGIGGFRTTAAVLSALKSDGHGGTLLSFGSGSSLDFTGVAASQLHTANFKIGS